VLVDKRADSLPACSYIPKLRNAFTVGASAAFVYDSAGVSGTPTPLVVPSPTQGRLSTGTLESQNPVFGLTVALATLFMKISAYGLPLHVSCYSSRYTDMNYTTFNIIAETPGGSEDSVVMLGSHLDSVPAGPGINDNGSGSSTNLELAVAFAKTFPQGTVNKVRFAWWAAEEIGLVGSYYYLSKLSAQEKSKIALNINFDMLGSGNYYMGVHDGSFANIPSTRNASMVITTLFADWFSSQGIIYKLISMGGGSDYYPFIQSGIPAGGLATGAGGIKQFDDRAMFGGLANTANDPCYHQSCDSMSVAEGSNVNTAILHENARAGAAVLAQLATMKDLPTVLGPRSAVNVEDVLDCTVDEWYPGGVSNRHDFEFLI